MLAIHPLRSDEWGTMNQTYSRNIGIDQAVQPRPQTQVGAQLDELNRELERLDKALATHSDKLQPVLRVTDPCVSDAKTPPEEVLVPTADRLRGICKRLTNYRLILEGMTERVEA